MVINGLGHDLQSILGGLDLEVGKPEIKSHKYCVFLKWKSTLSVLNSNTSCNSGRDSDRKLRLKMKNFKKV